MGIKHFEIVAYQYNGALYCIGCAEDITEQEGEDEKQPIFAGDEFYSKHVCDTCSGELELNVLEEEE